MRTIKKKSIFVLMTALSLIIIIHLLYSFQTSAIFEKAAEPLPGVNRVSLQGQVKYRYVGMQKCASVCHNNKEMGFQYDIVKNSLHSQAFVILFSEKASRYAKKALVKEPPMESAVCLRCHVTGTGLDSSFFAPTYRKEDGVTCEACHKGAFITKTFIPKEEDCLKCHNDLVHKMPKFNFSVNCAKIAHPRRKPIH